MREEGSALQGADQRGSRVQRRGPHRRKESLMKLDLRTALSSTFGFLALLVLAPPALATPPQTYSFSGTNSDVIHCGTFDDNFTDVFSARGTIFFDKAGES